MSFNIVHCADLHIGAPCSHLPHELAKTRREELLGALLNIIDFCKENAVDALLICGDLFDTPTPSKKDSDSVRKALSSLSPIPVYIICGNHDYMCSDSPFAQDNYFSENVHIFPTFEYSFDIPEKNVAIHGISYSSAIISPAFDSFPFDGKRLNIMCLHGDMTEGSDYCTIRKETLSRKNPNYVAFGHIHDGEIFECGNVKCAYSGTAESHKFSDDKFTGFIYAQISEEETKLSMISRSKRKYKNLSIDVSRINSEEAVKSLATQLCSTDCVRVSLRGEITASDDINPEYIKNELQDRVFYLEVSDNTSICYDFDMIETEQSLRGEFLRELRKISDSEEDFIISAKAGLDALSGEVPKIDLSI